MTSFFRAVSTVIGAAALVLGVAGPADAQWKHDEQGRLNFTVSDGTFEPLPIAVVDFSGDANAREISGVVSADLERSGLFRPIDPHSFVQTSDQLRAGDPRFADWKPTGAQALAAGTATMGGDGRLKVEFRLWDVLGQSYLAGFAYTAPKDSWRRLAHFVSDAIYKRLTGEDGYFDTRIVYIAESGPAQARRKSLAIMDQDGANHQFLTDGNNIVLTPRFSPTTQEITYMSYVNKRPRVYLFNIESARQEILGDFPGMTFAPRFSPDGNRVVMSMAQNGQTDIYTLDLKTRRQTRLTDSPGISTGPSYSPDGSQIAFESDRGGTQQIYVMDASGGNVHRLSFGDGKYGTPVWSPRGDYIAFTHQSGGHFAIGVMHPDGKGERTLTEAYHVEGPTWAPNGRVLAYFKDNGAKGGSSIYTIDITGRNERRLGTPMGASDPAWSPLIP